MVVYLFRGEGINTSIDYLTTTIRVTVFCTTAIISIIKLRLYCLRISAVLDICFALFPDLWFEVCLFGPQPVAQF